jgi:hypothetical protein
MTPSTTALKKPFHFLLSPEDEENVEFIKGHFLKTTGAVISNAELFRRLLRQEATILRSSQ